MHKKFIVSAHWIIVIVLSTSCSINTTLQDSAPINTPDLSKVRNAVPRSEPHSQYGNPLHYTVLNKTYSVFKKNPPNYKETGIASWYGTKFHGKRTSSGEPYDMFKMTAAHKTIRIPAYVMVKNLNNNKHIIVRVNDRGPFHDNRIIDLSYVAAKKLGVLKHGTAPVEIKLMSSHNKNILKHNTEHSIYLQLGAFQNKTNAEDLLHTLQLYSQFKTKEASLFINDSIVWHKVILGPINSKSLDRIKYAIEKITHKPTIILAMNSGSD